MVDQAQHCTGGLSAGKRWLLTEHKSTRAQGSQIAECITTQPKLMATQPRLSLLCMTATHPTPRPDHLQLWRHSVSIFVDISYTFMYMGYILSTLQLWRQSLSQLGSETCRSCRVCARVREQRSNFFVLGITLLYMGNEFTSSHRSKTKAATEGEPK